MKIAYAQQESFTALYNFLPMAINPATSGILDDGVALTLINYNQWIGVSDAPMNTTLGIDNIYKKNNFSIGGMINYQKYGPFSGYGFSGIVGYDFLVDRWRRRLSLAVSLTASNFERNTQLLRESALDPEVLEDYDQWSLNPSLGGYFYTEDYYVGISILHILPYRIDGQPAFTTTSNLMAGTKFPTSLEGDNIQVNAQLMYSFGINMVGNITLAYELRKKHTLGLYYWTVNSFGLMYRYQINPKFSFGASYNYQMVALSQGGSLEIMLKYQFAPKPDCHCLLPF